MDIKRVKSATKFYIIMGIIYFISTIVLVCAVLYSARDDIKNLFLLIFPLPFLFIITIGGGIVLVKAYMRKGEFNIYIMEKEGTINFDELKKDYIEVGDQYDKLYFVKEEDYNLYLDYSLTHVFN